MRSRSESRSILFGFVEQRFSFPAEWPLSAMASIRTLEERIVSLGACWAFWFSRAAICLAPFRFHLRVERGQAINAVTGTRFGLLSFTFLERFVFTRLRHCLSAAVWQRVVHFSAHPQVMPTAPPAFPRWPRWLASCRSFLHVQPASGPSAGRSQSTPNGPRICCAPCTNNVRR